MAAKTANILARVEPQIKEQAETIMAQLGVPASVVINMLYKQIIMTRSIPFNISLPSEPLASNEMTDEEFNAMMQRGLDEAKAGAGLPANEFFAKLRQELKL